MKIRSKPGVPKAWLIVFLFIGALFLFLVDSLTLTQVGDLSGRVSTLYPSGRTRATTRCHEVGVALSGGKVVIATVSNGDPVQCQIGAPILVRHFRTRILRLSSYESVQPNGAGL